MDTQGPWEPARPALRRFVGQAVGDGIGGEQLIGLLVKWARGRRLGAEDTADLLQEALASLAAELARLSADREVLVGPTERAVRAAHGKELEEDPRALERAMADRLAAMHPDEIYRLPVGQAVEEAVGWLGELFRVLDWRLYATPRQHRATLERLRDVAEALRAQADELYVRWRSPKEDDET